MPVPNCAGLVPNDPDLTFLFLDAQLGGVTCTALLDTGAADCFVSTEFALANQLNMIYHVQVQTQCYMNPLLMNSQMVKSSLQTNVSAQRSVCTIIRETSLRRACSSAKVLTLS
jgi:hypothetical protein